MSNMITAETILTLRRRLVDSLCKDNFFALDVIGYAIRENKLRYHDLVTEEGAELLTQTNSKEMKVMNTHHKEDGYTVYYNAEEKSFMAVDEDGMILFPPPKEVNPYL